MVQEIPRSISQQCCSDARICSLSRVSFGLKPGGAAAGLGDHSLWRRTAATHYATTTPTIHAVDLRRHLRHCSWLPLQPGAVPHGPGHAGPGPGRVSPPSFFLDASVAGQGATRDRAVIGSGPGRVHCVLLSPSRAGGPVSVRPQAHGFHLGRSLALWILSGASLRREPAPVAGCSRVSRPGQTS